MVIARWIATEGLLSEPTAYAEEMSFRCLCGRGWTVVVSANEPPQRCAACGRQYRLRVALEVMDPA